MKKKLFASVLTCLLLTGCNFAKSDFIQTSEPIQTSSTEAGSVDNSSELISSEAESSTVSKSSSLFDGLVKEIRFGEDIIELTIGKTTTPYYEIYPAIAYNHNVRWACSDYSIATIDEDGLINALKDGEVTITATAVDGGNASSSFTLKVNPVKINQIKMTPTEKSIEVNESFYLSCFIYPSNATYIDLVYKSEDESIAIVDEQGKVTGTGKGQTNIIVSSLRSPDVTNQCAVTVTDVLPKTITPNQTSCYLSVGQNFLFSVKILPENTTDKSVTFINENPDVVSVSETGEIIALAKGNAVVKARSNAKPELTTSISVTVSEQGEVSKTKLDYNYKDYTKNNIDPIDCADYPVCNALIVPVWFTDSSSYISSANKANVKADIEKAYLGSNEETGWRSVKTFYEEESRGRFTFNGVVTTWYECGQSSTSFYSEGNGGTRTMQLVSSAVSWYKSSYGISNMKGFDADENGYIDAVMLIYGAPDYGSSGNYNAGNMWAYCYWLQGNNANKNDPKPNTYFWASYDFMYGDGHAHESRYSGGDTSHCNIDAHTFIHEFGHIMGLDDYYDYNNGSTNPAAGFSMQDNNVGGHDPYSCMALGFVDPYVITEACDITIKDFQSSGDLILLTNEYHDSPFDEYILIELYTPTGLNEFDSVYKYQGQYPQGPKQAGIRIWHVDARLLYKSGNYGQWSESKVTTNPLISGNKVTHMMSNTTWGSGVSGYCSPLGRNYASYNLLQLIRNSTSAKYSSTANLSSSDMFYAGDTFTVSKFNKQFVKQYYLDSGEAFPFTVNVKSVSNSSATISITKA